MSLESLLQRPDLWRASAPARAEAPAVVATGYSALDRELAGGWPRGALSEILSPGQGLGGLGLLAPALARLSGEGRWIAWVDPPYLPYAPGLAGRGIELSNLLLLQTRGPADSLWTLEQALGSGACGAVLAWPRALEGRTLRRLQLAAESGRTLAWLFRPEAAARERSPAALRLGLRRTTSGVEVEILKRRGGWARGPLKLAAD